MTPRCPAPGPWRDGVLRERQEDHRRHRDAGDGGRDVPLQDEERRVAEEVELEEVAHQPELGGERPGRRLHPGEDRAQHRRELEDRALGHLAVLAAPLGDGAEGVEEEVRIEMRAERQQLGVLRLARELLGALLLPSQARFQADVAAEPPAADEEQSHAHDEARSLGEEGGTEVEHLGDEPPDDQDDAGADGDVEEQTYGAVLELGPVGEEHAPGEGRDEDERATHRDRQRNAQAVLAHSPLQHDERKAHHEDGEAAPRGEERAERASND